MTLVAHWSLDEGIGTTSAATEGTLGPVTGIKGWTPNGAAGQAIVTVGESGAQFTTPSALYQWSFAVRVRVRNTGGFASIVEETTAYQFYFDMDGLAPGVWAGGEVVRGTPVTDSAWTHLAITADRTTVRLYQDGAETDTGASNKVVRAASYWLGGSTSQPGNMDVDSLRIYDHALTPAEVTALAQPPTDPGGGSSAQSPKDASGTVMPAHLLTASGLVRVTPRTHQP